MRPLCVKIVAAFVTITAEGNELTHGTAWQGKAFKARAAAPLLLPESASLASSLMSRYRLQQQLEGKDSDDITSFLQRSFQRVILLADTFPEFFILKYEDYVDANLDALADFLGFSVKPAEVADKFKCVARTKPYGD